MTLFDRRTIVVLVLLAAAAILVPAMNILAEPGSAFHLSDHLVPLFGKYLCLRAAGPLGRPHLGLLRDPVPRPRGVLRARRLRHGHVPHAPDRRAGRLCQPDPAGLHGVPELEGTALVLARLRLVSLRDADGARGAGAPRLRVRLVRVPLAGHGRVSVHHHPGHDLRAHARLLPQRHGFRRQQRPDRFQGHPRLFRAGARRPAPCSSSLSAAALAGGYLLCRWIVTSEARQGAGRGARRREPHALPRVPRRALQAHGLHRLGHARRAGGRALRAAGRHHQSGRVRARQFHRGGDLGRGRRARHAGRRDPRRPRGECGQDLVHRRPAGVWLFALGGLFVFVTLFMPKGILGTAEEWCGTAAAQVHAATRRRCHAHARRSRCDDRPHHADPALSRQCHRLVRRLPGAECPVARRRPRGDARHHRPERRRQDDHDGRHHRQDATERGHGALRGLARPHRASTRLRSRSSASAASSRRPTVFDMHTRRGQPPPRAQGRPQALPGPVLPPHDGARGSGSTRCWSGCGSPPTGIARRPSSPTARSSGSRSACCSPRSPSSCWWTSRRPA